MIEPSIDFEDMTPFQQDVRRRQAASFGAVKIVTRDPHVCQKQLRACLKGDLLVWSSASGLWSVDADNEMRPLDGDKTDPFEVAGILRGFLRAREEQTTLVLYDYDVYLDNEPPIRRHVFEATRVAREQGHLILFVSRNDSLHAELHDEIGILRHGLPTREDTRQDLHEMLAKNDVTTEDIDAALDAVSGLTSTRQSDAFSLGVVDALMHERPTIDVATLRRFKEAEIGRLDYLKVSEPVRGFADVVGHGALKPWLLQRRTAFTPEARAAGVPVPKGCMFVGPPGTGKTVSAEALAAEWKVPYLTLDIGAVFSKYVGESEQQISNALEIAERLAPCVLLIDEVERAFGGGSGERDGGTSERVTGKVLSWMSTKTAPVFVIFTSNEAKNLPAQLVRKGRLDQIWFMDFPNVAQRRAVFDYYLAKANHELTDDALDKLVTDTHDWSPSEIEAAIGDARTAAYADGERFPGVDDFKAAFDAVVPNSTQYAEQVKGMRDWAEAYARPTDAGTTGEPQPKKRKAQRRIEV